MIDCNLAVGRKQGAHGRALPALLVRVARLDKGRPNGAGSPATAIPGTRRHGGLCARRAGLRITYELAIAGWMMDECARAPHRRRRRRRRRQGVAETGGVSCLLPWRTGRGLKIQGRAQGPDQHLPIIGQIGKHGASWDTGGVPPPRASTCISSTC